MDEHALHRTSPEDLRAWLDENPPQDADALGTYLLRAARLAAGGDADCLLRWPKLAATAGLDAIAALRGCAIVPVATAPATEATVNTASSAHATVQK